jgi:hypothetical protein
MSSQRVRCFLWTSGLCRARTAPTGDALDVLVLSDEPLFTLCLVQGADARGKTVFLQLANVVPAQAHIMDEISCALKLAKCT